MRASDLNGARKSVPGNRAGERKSSAERTRFYDADGNEIAFNRGQTWVEVLAVSDPLSYWAASSAADTAPRALVDIPRGWALES